MYALYIAFASAFASFIIWNVLRSVSEMTPGHRQEAGRTLSQAECIERAVALWNELEEHRKALADHHPVTAADDDWPAFRVRWLTRHRDTEAVCAVESRPALKDAFTLLDKAMDL